jgi:hypothetical protein
VAGSTRTTRFPAAALRLLLSTRPFSLALWQAATSPSLQVRIGNAAAVSGQPQALAAMQSFLEATTGFGCGFCEHWAIREAILIEAEVDYRDASGATHRIPCVVIARTTYGLLYDLRFHLDPSPLPGYPSPD